MGETLRFFLTIHERLSFTASGKYSDKYFEILFIFFPFVSAFFGLFVWGDFFKRINVKCKCIKKYILYYTRVQYIGGTRLNSLRDGRLRVTTIMGKKNTKTRDSPRAYISYYYLIILLCIQRIANTI